MVEQARAALARSSDLLREALASNPERDGKEVDRLVDTLKAPLIDETHSHGAVIGADDAIKFGLPVTRLDPIGAHWKNIWRLWTNYAILGEGARIYEGSRASQIKS